jgi:hypothetical protein
MKTIKRVLFSTIITLCVSVLVVTLAYAATGYVSEQSADFTSSNLNAASGCSSSTCQDSNAKYANQSGSTSSTTAWGNWYTSVDNVDEWYTFIPNLSGDWAAVIYSIGNSSPPHEVYYTTVNQNNWKGSYVYLGNFDYNSTWAQMYLPNKCVVGYACDGRRLYYDKSKFIY